MQQTLHIKKFTYESKEKEIDDFIASVDLPAQNAIVFRDNGIFIWYMPKRDENGISKQEHLDNLFEELGRAESSLIDALLSQSEADTAWELFKGKKGFKKQEEAFFKQTLLAQDTVNNKRSSVMALKNLIEKIESGEILVGKEALEKHMETFSELVPEPEDEFEAEENSAMLSPIQPDQE